MVLGMTYEQAAEKIPIQDLAELRANGVNKLGLQGLDAILELAEERNLSVISFDYTPSTLTEGIRYLAIVPAPSDDPLMSHTVAIDESGTVFDPDPAQAESRKYYKDYDIWAVLGFKKRA